MICASVDRGVWERFRRNPIDMSPKVQNESQSAKQSELRFRALLMESGAERLELVKV
jgi:hypothetical protein